MGCAGSTQTGGSIYPQATRHTSYNNTDYTGGTGDTGNNGGGSTGDTGNNGGGSTGGTVNNGGGSTGGTVSYGGGGTGTFGGGGFMISYGSGGTGGTRQPTPPPPREPTPPPPREPTPPPPREPTPPPPREPTPPPPREPTPPPPREPTPPPPREPTPPPPMEPTPPPPREPTPPPPMEPTPPPPVPPPSEPTPPAPEPLDNHGKDTKDGKSGAVRENYKLSHGIYECKAYEFRKRPEPLDKDFEEPPQSYPFEDINFGPTEAIEREGGGEMIGWKRPGELQREAPVLFSDGTTRYDVGQGAAGTCWFLSMVAMLSERPELFHRVVPLDAWNQEGGYFFCYFWRHGEWEKIYIDDYLPIVHGTELWGAKSREDRNEMWPAFLEKAFARFHGNYNAVYGGQAGDAFLALTGGCSEYIDFDDALEADAEGSTMTKARQVHSRMKNACRQGESMLTTEVPEKYDGHCGLVGGHAYSLTNAVSVKLDSGRTEHLVRVRNPWGHTEWTGAWSDGSREWSGVPKGSIPHANKDDGEFWMSLRDFIKYFSGITVCSVVPDFDRDGIEDSLNFCTNMYGDWFGPDAAGFNNRISNPRYMFHIDDEGMDTDGKIPLVIQICQKLTHRKKNKASIRVDLYKVLGERTDGSHMVVMELLGDVTNVYKKERQMSGRYKVEPGYYAVVPSTMSAGVEKEFLCRVYSPSPLREVRELGRECIMMESKEFKTPENVIADPAIRYIETFFGRFVTGHNAGGQIKYLDTYHHNPQLEFEIPSGGEVLVNATLMQESSAEDFAIGIRTFVLEEGHSISKEQAHMDYIYRTYDSPPKSIKGEDNVFVWGSPADITYVLGAGRYSMLLHLDNPREEKNYALIIRSSRHLTPRLHHQ